MALQHRRSAAHYCAVLASQPHTRWHPQTRRLGSDCQAPTLSPGHPISVAAQHPARGAVLHYASLAHPRHTNGGTPRARDQGAHVGRPQHRGHPTSVAVHHLRDAPSPSRHTRTVAHPQILKPGSGHRAPTQPKSPLQCDTAALAVVPTKSTVFITYPIEYWSVYVGKQLRATTSNGQGAVQHAMAVVASRWEFKPYGGKKSIAVPDNIFKLPRTGGRSLLVCTTLGDCGKVQSSLMGAVYVSPYHFWHSHLSLLLMAIRAPKDG